MVTRFSQLPHHHKPKPYANKSNIAIPGSPPLGECAIPALIVQGWAVGAHDERVLLFLCSRVSFVIDTGEVLEIEVGIDLGG